MKIISTKKINLSGGVDKVVLSGEQYCDGSEIYLIPSFIYSKYFGNFYVRFLRYEFWLRISLNKEVTEVDEIF